MTLPLVCLLSEASAATSIFTGKERDSESGNDYFGARYYASSMGRWMSPDKPFADQHVANPQSWNLYSYTRNNPLRFVDEDGQIVVETRDTTYYQVSGATANEALTNAGQHFSGEFGGMTNSHMDFTYQFSRTPSQNGDSSFTVKDTVTSDTSKPWSFLSGTAMTKPVPKIRRLGMRL
jgi:RHS repeat-associated protein